MCEGWLGVSIEGGGSYIFTYLGACVCVWVVEGVHKRYLVRLGRSGGHKNFGDTPISDLIINDSCLMIVRLDARRNPCRAVSDIEEIAEQHFVVVL